MKLSRRSLFGGLAGVFSFPVLALPKETKPKSRWSVIGVDPAYSGTGSGAMCVVTVENGKIIEMKWIDNFRMYGPNNPISIRLGEDLARRA